MNPIKKEMYIEIAAVLVIAGVTIAFIIAKHKVK